MSLEAENEGDFKLHFVHRTTLNEPCPFVSPKQLTAT